MDFFLNKILWLLKETAFIYFTRPNHSLMPILVHLWHSAPWKLQRWSRYVLCILLQTPCQKRSTCCRDKRGSLSLAGGRCSEVERFMGLYLPKALFRCVDKTCINTMTLHNISFVKFTPRQYPCLKGLDVLCSCATSRRGSISMGWFPPQTVVFAG